MKTTTFSEPVPRTIELTPTRRWARPLVFLAGATLLLSGCTPSSPDASATPTPTPKPGQSLFETFNPQYGDCRSNVVEFFAHSPELLAESGQDCVDVYEDDDIALINYALDPEVAEEYADDIEEQLEQATQGLINPTITVIEPSKLARSIFEFNTSSGCIEIGNIEDYGSFVAAATMPKLAKYDQILGISDVAACGGGIDGVADGSYQRYAEIFQTKQHLDQVEDNNGEHTIVTPFGNGGGYITQSLSNPVLEAVHEELHNMSLGHSGKLINGGHINDALRENSNLNLNNYFATGFYDEYGDQDVMGNPPELPNGATLNTVQMGMLEWAERSTDQKYMDQTIVEMQASWAKPAVFTADNAGAYVAKIPLGMTLPFPVTFGSTSEYGAAQIYDTLMISGEKFDDKLNGIRVYVVGKSGNIVDLGLITTPANPQETVHYELSVPGTNIYIDFLNGEATVNVPKTMEPMIGL